MFLWVPMFTEDENLSKKKKNSVKVFHKKKRKKKIPKTEKKIYFTG